MLRSKSFSRVFLVLIFALATSSVAMGQRTFNSTANSNPEFGPVMQAYLGYLRNEQEVVDDRNSRREITADYYRRNSNRIRALRQMAIRLVTKSRNDYVPELEAVTTDEFGTLFENPPSPRSFRMNQVVMNTFRYLGSVSSGELFYVFARLDPYEQAALIESRESGGSSETPEEMGVSSSAKGQRVGQTTTRPRRTAPR